jgi:hypothetical protein
MQARAPMLAYSSLMPCPPLEYVPEGVPGKRHVRPEDTAGSACQGRRAKKGPEIQAATAWEVH